MNQWFSTVVTLGPASSDYCEVNPHMLAIQNPRIRIFSDFSFFNFFFFFFFNIWGFSALFFPESPLPLLHFPHFFLIQNTLNIHLSFLKNCFLKNAFFHPFFSLIIGPTQSGVSPQTQHLPMLGPQTAGVWM